MGVTLQKQALSCLVAAVRAEGMSQVELSRLTGYSEKHISLALRGKSRLSFQFAEDCMTVLGYRFSVMFAERGRVTEATAPSRAPSEEPR